MKILTRLKQPLSGSIVSLSLSLSHTDKPFGDSTLKVEMAQRRETPSFGTRGRGRGGGAPRGAPRGRGGGGGGGGGIEPSPDDWNCPSYVFFISSDLTDVRISTGQ